MPVVNAKGGTPATLFITPGMSIFLDAVRALAAIAVLCGHAVQAGLYTGPFPFDMRMQHFAVIVFFVLSGLVIAHSTSVRSLDLREYAIARVARIVPVAWFAVLFGSVLFLVSGPSSIDVGNHDTLDGPALIMPLLFMNESFWGSGPVWNPPYWSLAYEMWFYILFAGAIYSPQKWRWAVLALLGFLAGWRILLMLPIWLIGVWLARKGGNLPCGPRASILLVLTAALTLHVASTYHDLVGAWMQAFHLVNGYDLKFSLNFATDLLFGLGVAAFFIGMRPLADKFEPLLVRAKAPVAYLAGFSYTLYIVHWPILMALDALGVTAGNSIPRFLLYLSGIMGFAALVATQLEYRSGDLRRWILQRTERLPRTGKFRHA